MFVMIGGANRTRRFGRELDSFSLRFKPLSEEFGALVLDEACKGILVSLEEEEGDDITRIDNKEGVYHVAVCVRLGHGDTFGAFLGGVIRAIESYRFSQQNEVKVSSLLERWKAGLSSAPASTTGGLL